MDPSLKTCATRAPASAQLIRSVKHRRDAPEPRDAEEPHRVHAQMSAGRP